MLNTNGEILIDRDVIAGTPFHLKGIDMSLARHKIMVNLLYNTLTYFQTALALLSKPLILSW